MPLHFHPGARLTLGETPAIHCWHTARGQPFATTAARGRPDPAAAARGRPDPASAPTKQGRRGTAANVSNQKRQQTHTHAHKLTHSACFSLSMFWGNPGDVFGSLWGSSGGCFWIALGYPGDVLDHSNFELPLHLCEALFAPFGVHILVSSNRRSLSRLGGSRSLGLCWMLLLLGFGFWVLGVLVLEELDRWGLWGPWDLWGLCGLWILGHV